ncbi:DoxX family protein [Hydrotalea sandarakina]|jgi:hypothetical protein|uniref:DoxX-like protein n=1 Tax=Hydrotalea sandarakina TaxID=1004304 RepID=A0A2W7RG63_9BACT|nr:DoxX family protein [Hydrotalea sandarakina]PZX59404.1 DoxX-like protein [Hydrotalea sandarakina]
MKRLNIFYWVFTGLLIPSLGYGSIMELMGNPQSIEIITSLGYPAYLSPFLGVARILALIAIFTPNFPRLKEWAYAGLVFDVIGATYSQIAVGNPLTYTIFPTIILGVILGSYYFHHKRLTVNS